MVWIDERTANISAEWCSSRCRQLEEGSSQGSVQSGVEFETFIATGLLRDLVRHADDWEGVRPWPRPLPAGRDPDGADDLTLDEVGKEKNNSPLVAGVSIFARVWKPTAWRPIYRKSSSLLSLPPGTTSTLNSGPARSLPSKLLPNQYQSLGPNTARCLSLPRQPRDIFD